jgi:organic radical activating enzyme
MEGIKRFFECLLPVSVCNLECEYCYIIQDKRRKMELAQMKYSPAHIAKAMRKERLGGTCLISICGAGETLVQEEAVEIAGLLLKEGHFVNITTNGTLSNRFDALIAACGENIDRLHISFSLHYVELIKKGWVTRFFDNVCKMRDAGASILVQMNLCDAYVPYIDEIKQITMDRVGAWPQAALTREQRDKPITIYTAGSRSEYLRQGSRLESPLFDFTVTNFNVKRKEFCYAGAWSGVLNLATGKLRKCYANGEDVDIFADVNTPIDFSPVGWECRNAYCVNSSHFMSLGVIPSVKTPSYSELRNRSHAGWQTPKMERFLNTRLYDSNPQYSEKELRNMKRRHRENKLRGRLAQFPVYQWLHKLKERG